MSKKRGNASNEDETPSSKRQRKEIDDDSNSTYREVGQVIKIEVENFMCHRKFEMEFGSHVNIITGKNGSGKSAIVSALQLCLGASARVTDRGSNLSSFVRQDSSGPACVRVTLLNTGSDAYRPDLFGNKITIERKISKGSGGGGYALYSSDGLKVPKGDKRMLIEILNAFNIYADNPCCILTQEESKNFIRSNAKEKYKFFLRATGLHQIKCDLTTSTENVEKAVEDFNACEENLSVKEEELKQLAQDFAFFTSFNVEEQKMRFLKSKYQWANVRDCKVVLNKLTRRENEFKKHCDDCENVVRERQADLDAIGNIDSIRSKLEALQREHDDVTATSDRASDLCREASIKLGRTKGEIAKYTRDIQTLQKNRAEIEKSMENRLLAASSASDSQEQELTQRLREIKEQEKELATRLRELTNQRNSRSYEEESKKKDVDSLRSQIREAIDDISKLDNEIREISDNRDKTAVFGRGIPRLREKIAKTKFRNKVLGPIGADISLIDKEFENAITKSLMPVLRSFLVFDDEDERRLRAMMNEIGNDIPFKSVIKMRADRRYRVNQPSDIRTVLSCVNITSDEIFNCVIDKCSPEAIAVMKDDDECNRSCVINTGGRPGLRQGLKHVVLKNCVTIRYKNGNKSREQTGDDYRGLLATDGGELIASKRAEIDQLKNSIHSWKGELRTAESSLQDFKSQFQELENRKSQLEKEIYRCKEQGKRVQSELNDIWATRNVDVSADEREIEDIDAKLRDIESRRAARQAALSSEEEMVAEHIQKRDSLKNRTQELLKQLSEVQEDLQEFLNNKRQKASLLSEAKDDFNAYKGKLDNVQSELSKQQTKYEETVVEAEQISKDYCDDWDGQPIPVGDKETMATINRELEVLQKTVEEKRQRNERLAGTTLEEVSKKFERARTEFEELKRLKEQRKCQVDRLSEDVAKREYSWKEALKKSTEEARVSFDNYLQDKGFAGTVIFQSSTETVEIECTVDNLKMQQKDLCSDINQLSGGERSYTALCLLLAFAQSVETPFRFMDECDVFMDEISRKVTMESLIRFTREPKQHSSQLFIITPHNLSGIPAADDVKIQVMPDPERGTLA